MLQRLFGLLYISAVSQLVILTGTHTQCPIKISPKRAVVRYNSSVSVNCSTDITHDGIGWEASEGGVPMNNKTSLITWSVSNLRVWDINPFCFINYDEKQCEIDLPVTVYKTPDSVSISTVNHTGPVTEGSMLNLQCDIMNVAPVQYLDVRWYRGQKRVAINIFNDTIKTPVSKSVKFQIIPDRADDGAQYRCEAELQLGAEGPQPPPTVTSEPLNITVHYPPKHISLMETIKKTDGELTLNCTVAANPPPTYTWSSELLTEKISSSVMSSSTLSPGNYTCTAANFLGASSKVFIINSAGRHPTLMANLIFLQLLVALRTVI